MKILSQMIALVLFGGMVLTGCTTVKDWVAKRNDGSLAYQNSRQLPPIQLPLEQETAAFVPFYQVPQVTPQPTDESQPQYQLPIPPKVIR